MIIDVINSALTHAQQNLPMLPDQLQQTIQNSKFHNLQKRIDPQFVIYFIANLVEKYTKPNIHPHIVAKNTIQKLNGVHHANYHLYKMMVTTVRYLNAIANCAKNRSFLVDGTGIVMNIPTY